VKCLVFLNEFVEKKNQFLLPAIQWQDLQLKLHWEFTLFISRGLYIGNSPPRGDYQPMLFGGKNTKK
jgi:hypothetical protein